MKKKISIILFAIILCLAAVVPVFAESKDGFASEHYCVIDEAGLLSDDEREALENKIESLQGKIDNMNMPEYLLSIQRNIILEKVRKEKQAKDEKLKKEKLEKKKQKMLAKQNKNK